MDATAYDGFESVRELHRDGEKSVARACPTGKPRSDHYVLKRLAPLQAFSGADTSRKAIEAFLQATKLQRGLAAGGARHWAPIHAAGPTRGEADGAYYVTDQYPRSAHKLATGKVRLEGSSLHAILSGVMTGLAELDRAAGRPHGNIKATNILIGAGSEITPDRVFLTDPAPTLSGDAKQDYAALGRVLFEMVFFRPFSQTRDWPLPASGEWPQIDAHTEAWRTLCGRLISDKGIHTGDELAEALAPLDGRRARRYRRARGIAGATLLILAGTVALHPQLRQHRFVRKTWQTTRETGRKLLQQWNHADDQEAWHALCTAYAEWFGTFSSQLTPERRALWADDPHLNEILARIDAVTTPLDPRQITDTPGSHLAYLRDHPPDQLKERECQANVQAALDTIAAMRDRVRSGTWSALQQVQEAGQCYQQRGWQAPAAELAFAVAAVQAAPNNHVLDSMDRILEISAQLPRVEWHWESLNPGAQRELTAAVSTERLSADTSPASGRSWRALLERCTSGPAPHATDATQAVARAIIVATPPVTPSPPPPQRPTFPPLPPHISLTSSPAIDHTWQTWTAGLRDRCEDTTAFKRTSSQCRQFLLDLDWSVAVNPRPELANANGQWRPQLLAEVWRRREEALGASLALLDEPDISQELSLAGFRKTAAWGETLAPYEAWRTSLPENAP